MPLDVRSLPGRRPKAKLENNQAKHGDRAVTKVGALAKYVDQPVENHIHDNQPTSSSLKPNAEPTTIAMSASQPRP